MARWLALESNPEVLTKYIHALGASPQWSLVDVFGLDDDLLGFIPQPAVALLLLFPVKDIKDAAKGGEGNPKVFYMKQTIQNACGTIGILHSLANNREQVPILPDTPLAKFLSMTKDKSPEERGKILETSDDLHKVHDSFAREGQTATPNLEDDVDLHFVSIVLADGHIYELDGRKTGPVKHGPSSPEDFLKNAAAVCKEFMKKMPGVLSFSLAALVKN